MPFPGQPLLGWALEYIMDRVVDAQSVLNASIILSLESIVPLSPELVKDLQLGCNATLGRFVVLIVRFPPSTRR